MTDEPPSLVDKWVADLEPAFPVVALKDSQLESFLRVEFFPTVAVIKPDGTLAYTGNSRSYDEALEAALETADKAPLWPKSLSKVAKLMEDGKLDKSYETLLKLIEGGKIPEEDTPVSDRFRSYLEGLAATALADGQRHFDEGFVFRAVDALEFFAETKAPFPASPDCKKLLEELEAMPTFKDEMKGGELYSDAEAQADVGEFTDAVDTYRSILKKCKDTRIAEHALAAAKKLVEDGMYGFERACAKCNDARRACAKHAEEVEI